MTNKEEILIYIKKRHLIYFIILICAGRRIKLIYKKRGKVYVFFDPPKNILTCNINILAYFALCGE